MVPDLSKINGVNDFTKKEEKLENSSRNLYFKNEKVFLVENPHTLEIRTDDKLRELLVEKYESVMNSRYFGKGGIEIVLAGNQLNENEIKDLIRLSYDLS